MTLRWSESKYSGHFFLPHNDFYQCSIALKHHDFGCPPVKSSAAHYRPCLMVRYATVALSYRDLSLTLFPDFVDMYSSSHNIASCSYRFLLWGPRIRFLHSQMATTPLCTDPPLFPYSPNPVPCEFPADMNTQTF
jgi:hypothetical protein